jgi:hypothetical protein
MPKATNYADNWFLLLDNNTTYANVGNAAGLVGSSGAGSPGSLYVSLHTGDPGLTGDQTVNEASYTGYGRVAVARSAAGWTVSGNQVSNTANVTFNPCSGGSSTVTWFGIGTAASGTGQLLYAFPLIQTYYDFVAQTSGNLFYNNSSLATTTPIQLMTNPGGSLPGGFVQGTTYYVHTVTGTNFTVSATSGGADITVTAAGSGLLGQIASLAVSSGITPQFLAGQLIIYEV